MVTVIVDVGTPVETTAQHVQRHRRQAEAVGASCARCCFAEHEKDLRKLARHGRPGPTEVNWLNERPMYMGGSWGLGCSLCAWHARRPCRA